MPQLQLPIFPAGATEINNNIAVQCKNGKVVYSHGHLPVFQHEENSVKSFRYFTSHMILNPAVRPRRSRQTAMFSLPRDVPRPIDAGVPRYFDRLNCRI